MAKTTETIRVNLSERSYDVHYLSALAYLDTGSAKGKEFALIDANVDRLYGKVFRRQLKHVHFIRIPSGERSKSFVSLEKIANQLVTAGATRQSRLIAIGGGVVGDLTGFLAGVLMRGIPFIQIPTTLLAMVDSSVGGKTAVNISAGKNLVGVFHQPAAVFVIPDLLKTLPARELRCGISESIKTALIADAGLVEYLEAHDHNERKFEPEFLRHLSAACIRIKADIVAKDEKEENIRAFLNFGHTLGHAIEAKAGYKGILHGEAVAVGQGFAALLSRRLGYLSSADEKRVHSLLKKYGLPARIQDVFRKKAGAPGIKPADLVKLMRADKKNQSNSIRFVLLSRIGAAALPQAVPEQELLASLKEFQTLA